MRLMLDLALNNTGAPISLKRCCKTSGDFRQISGADHFCFKPCRLCAQCARSAGGYLLRKAPEEYTVGMILRLTEGSLAPVACLDEGDDVDCEKQEECVTLILWKKINDAICSVVDHITLQDLVDWQREKMGIT